MKRDTIPAMTSILLILATIICAVSGFVRWPGLISALGFSYRQVPVVLVNELHIWSGLGMVILSIVHVFQFRRRLMSRMRNLISQE